MGYPSIFEQAMAGTRQFGRQGRRGRRAGINCRLRLEPLEDRRCPSTITVTSAADAGAGTLRNALAKAVNGDTIDFASALDGQTIVLTSGQLNIQSAISIVGPGANLLSISDPTGLVFRNIALGPASISSLTIRDGVGGDLAGGIINNGTLLLQGCVLTNNSSLDLGGAILNQGSLQVINCTLAQNHSGNQGGAIYNQGLLSVANSTLTNNGAFVGGAIYDAGNGCTLTSVTVTGNVASDQAGGVDAPTDQPILDNSIIAANNAPADPDVVGVFASKGFNLIGAIDGGSGWIASDLTGTAALPLNPVLGALQANGGSTPTIAILAHSPALNTGDPILLGTQDQRGITRGPHVDIGAFQVPAAVKFLVSAPVSATAGIGFQITVTALDASNNVAIGYTGTIAFSSSDVQALLPIDTPFSTNDAGTKTFIVTQKTAGRQSLAVADTLSSSLAGLASITVLNPGPQVTLPPGPTVSQAGTLYTATGSFSDPAFDAYSATVNYGDGTASTPLVLASDHTFVLNHVYAREGAYTVTVTVAGTNGPSGQATALVNVFPGTFTNPVIVIVPPGQTGTATTSVQTPAGTFLVSATLTRAPGDIGPGIILVAIYPVDPVPEATLPATIIAAAFEVRGINLTPQDTILVTFEVPGLGRQTAGSQLLFFNTVTGKLQPVIGIDPASGKPGPITGTTTAGQLILATILNSSTIPPVTGLSGTVFTVAVSTTVLAALQVNSPVAEAPRAEQTGVTTDVPAATAVRTTTFLRTSSLSLTLRSSQDVQSGDSHQPGGGDAPAPDNGDQASLLQTILDSVLELFGLKARAKTPRPAPRQTPARSPGPQSWLPVPWPWDASWHVPAPALPVVGGRFDNAILDQVLTSGDWALPKVAGDGDEAITNGKAGPVHLLTALAAGAIVVDAKPASPKRRRQKGARTDSAR